MTKRRLQARVEYLEKVRENLTAEVLDTRELLAAESRHVADLSMKLMRLEAGVEPMRRETDRLRAAGRVLAEQLDVDAIRELSDAVDRFVPTEEMKSNLGQLAAVAAGDIGNGVALGGPVAGSGSLARY